MQIETFINTLIKTANQRGRYSTANAYQCTLHSYQRFTQNPSQTFEEMTPEEMKNYEQFMIKNGLKHNTISLYIRMLRSICNQAIAQKVAHINAVELFQDVFMGCKPTAKRAIKPSIIGHLIDADFAEHPHLAFSRDLFLLSFYLRGIPFVDLVYMRKSDIKDNTLIYFRQKTGKVMYVTIESCAKKLIKKYASECKDSIYLLPIIKSVGEEGHKQYRSALRLYNKHLHQISKLLKLGIILTSYVARHSWATTAQNTDVPIAVISTSMGHASEKVTHIYLDSFENKKLSDANKKVIACIMKENKKQKKSSNTY